MDNAKEVGVNTKGTVVATTLRGIPEKLHWKIQEESLKRKRTKYNGPTTVNDIYLELIEKGEANYPWSK